MPPIIIIPVAGVAVAYLFLRFLAYITYDPRQPPPVNGVVPFISPLIGMITENGGFYLRMWNEHKLPIYTLRVPGPPIYVVNSLAVCQRINRHIMTVAFSPVQIRACEKAIGVGEKGMEILSDDRHLEKDGYLRGFPSSSTPATAPGPGLDALSSAAVATFATSTDQLSSTGRSTVDLYQWICHQILAATTEATYGPHNPFRDAKIAQAWFDFEPTIMTLIIDVLPKVFLWRGLHARSSMVDALNDYLEKDQHQEGSLFVQLRRQRNIEFGLSVRDSAHTELGQIAAGMLNTAPTTFWLIWTVLSDPIILRDCREEAEALVKVEDGTYTIDLAQVRTACPIMLSTWQETLRFHGISPSPRLIKEDTMVDNFLLKKGATLLMPSGTVHTDKTIWGPDANMFDHKRFLKSESRTGQPATSAFRGFGSGHVICPGRHFATTEALALLTLMLVRFDVLPAGGKWITPKKHMSIDRASPLPIGDTKVEVIPRNRHKWRVLFSRNNSGLDIAGTDGNDGSEGALNHKMPDRA
ncbi:cytochrome P450 [Stachybotrys elegans]|uniref:Cytochrome P450 n=1 Tax=Stachybotrys elegans TaxID=80388 RepID=A0A8K0WJ06_9HYPO|nr:cytochrome P450 [Stachybotrys elegans]